MKADTTSGSVNEHENIWSEIHNHHDELRGTPKTDDIIKCIAIDGYIGSDDESPGEVIAKVILTERGDVGTIYINGLARSDPYAQEVIQSTISNIKDKRFITVRQKNHSCTVVEWTSGEEDENILARCDCPTDAAKALAGIIADNRQIDYRIA